MEALERLETASLLRGTVTDPNSDPTIRQLRAQIFENDRRLIDTLNVRLHLVSRVRHYKASRGFAFVDREREEWMLRDLLSVNAGPLSPDGLREIYAAILDLTKREVSHDADPHEG